MKRRKNELSMSFDDVYKKIYEQPDKKTPELFTTGGTSFTAEAKYTRDRRRFISLPHSNRIYEKDWGYQTNSMGRSGQRIGQYSEPIDDWANGLN